MRTDSVSLASEAIQSIRSYIGAHYGESEVPEKPNVYKTKAKNAQEAHEAIRPTDVDRAPRTLSAHLSADQLKLYTPDLEAHHRLTNDSRRINGNAHRPRLRRCCCISCQRNRCC